MNFVEYVTSLCQKAGMNTVNVVSAELVVLDDFVDEATGRPIPVSIRPCGETLHGEMMIELSSPAMELPDIEEGLVAYLLLSINGLTHGQMSFWGGASYDDTGDWYAAYIRLTVNAITPNAFSLMVAALVSNVLSVRESMLYLIDGIRQLESTD